MSCRMTLGNVYDLDLKTNESLIKEVIVQAQGEVTSVYGIHPYLLLISLTSDGS